MPMPPAMLTTPAPEPELLAPATMLMAPPRPPVARPPCSRIVPAFPDVATPLLRVSVPEEPTEAAFADARITLPDPELVLCPEKTSTLPATVPRDNPAENMRSPPRPEEVRPTTRLMPPARPPVATPV